MSHMSKTEYQEKEDAVADALFLRDRVAKLERERDELKAIVEQVEARGGKDGHIYYGPDCILCGHFGPTDEPEPCDAEKRFALLKRERDEARQELEVAQSVASANGHAALVAQRKAAERQRNAAWVDAEQLRTALRRIANAETRPQDKESLVGRMLLACVSVAREALKGGGA